MSAGGKRPWLRRPLSVEALAMGVNRPAIVLGAFIVVLIAPQVALLGTEAYAVLAVFSYAFLLVSALILLVAIVTLSVVLRVPIGAVVSSMLKPIMLGAATREHAGLHSGRTGNDDEGAFRQARAVRAVRTHWICGDAVWNDHLLRRSSYVHGHLTGAHLLAERHDYGGGALCRSLLRSVGLVGPAALAPLTVVLRPFGRNLLWRLRGRQGVHVVRSRSLSLLNDQLSSKGWDAGWNCQLRGRNEA